MQEVMTFISNHALLSWSIVLVFVLLTIIEFMRAKQSSASLTPVQVTQMMNHDNAVIIDLRPTDLYKKGHIIDAKSMTPQEIQQTPKKLERFKSKPVIVVCNTGQESQKMAAVLLKQGYNAFALTGGIRGWTEAQMPLIKE